MRSEMPGEVDRYNMRRYLSLTANVEGEDLGRVIDRLDAAIARAGQPPKGIEVELRGQVKPMKQMFQSLEIGLAVAVVVILIMLTAYFQAPRLAVTAVASVPAVLCGVVLALWVTRTTLNIESFMGAIMAVGVAVSNAIMLVSFGDRHRREEGMPADRAAITAAKGRLRPIIMTGCAMISGMIPMSLGLEEGSEQNAPLGRAVIGGMALATFATLLVLPAVFTLLLGRASNQSPSLDPDDPASTHYDPIHPTRRPTGRRADGQPTRPPSRPTAPTATGGRTPCRRQRLSRGRRPSPSDRPDRPGAGRPGPPALRPAAGTPTAAETSASRKAAGPTSEEGKTAGIRVVQPERRDIRMTVVQPGTIQAFEVTPIYSRISGYVEKYRYNIGDRVKAGDVLLDMWIPDLVEQHRPEVGGGEAGRGPDPRGRERAAGRRGEARDGQGPHRLGRGRRQAGPGQLHPLGVGVQAARDAGQPARPRRPGPRRDVSPVRGGRRGARSGQRDGLRDELRARPGDRRPRPGPRRRRGRPRRPAGRPGRRAGGPGHRRVRPDQGPLRRRDHPAQRQPRRLPPARRRHQTAGRCSSSSRPTRSASSWASPSWPPSSSTTATRP